LGISLGAVQNWETDSSPPAAPALLKIHDIFKININWLLTGNGHPNEVYHDAPHADLSAQNGNNVIESKHADIIKRFIDKQSAVELNLSLVELEKLSPEAYKKMSSYIKGVVDGIKMASQFQEQSEEEDQEGLIDRPAVNQ
jgi:transcriptional regulator with XRE-family HTH domain